MGDPVNHPDHYTSHPSGVECIQIAEHMNFCLGNALKYVFRRSLKDSARTDLRKARWYIDREIDRLGRAVRPPVGELLEGEPNSNIREVFAALWRAGRKGDAVENLKKARWYIDREIKRLED